MATRRTAHGHRTYENSVSIYGHFYPDGANPISTQSATGGTFARTGQGVFTFTFAEPVISGGYSYPWTDLNMGTPDGSYAVISSVSQAASGIITVTIKVYDSTNNLADIVADATNVVTFKMMVRVKGP